MCPLPPVSVLIEIDVDSSDEEVVLYLDRRRVCDPIPSNVITEVNPFTIDPRTSPEGIWFLYNLEDIHSHKEGSIIKSTNGYWKSMDDSRIPTSTPAVGRKTTMDFYIGQAPLGEKTNWRMLEYQADQVAEQGSNESQEKSTLCRFFLQEDEMSNTVEYCDPVACGDANCECVESMLLGLAEQEERNSSSREAANETHMAGEDGQMCQDLVPDNSMAGGQADYDFLKEDFLELKDLYDPESSASSSDNSSLMSKSMNSDECFDAEALLRDIENDGMDLQENVNSRFSVTASVRSDRVVISPPPLPAFSDNTNLVVRENRSANSSPASDPSTFSSAVGLQSDNDASMSGSSHGSRASASPSGSSQGSSSSQGSGSKSIRRMAKFRKRYCCFGSF